MLWTEIGRFGTALDPWVQFGRLGSEMDRFFSGAVAERGSDFPPVNLWTKGDEVVLTTEIPGIDPDKVDISVAGKTVTIKGSRKAEPVKEDEVYHRRERWYGDFTKTLELPFTIEADKVQARFARGVLSVVLTKAEVEKPRKIRIKSE